MFVRLINWILSAALLGTLLSILFIGAGYLLVKPSLPEIDLVDEDVLQIPLKPRREQWFFANAFKTSSGTMVFWEFF